MLIFGPFWQFWVIFGPIWAILDHFWTILGNLTSFLGHFFGANFFVAKYASVLFKSLFATLLNNNTFTIMVIPGYIENLQSCDLKFWISPSMVILPVFAFNVSSILCHSPGNILWWLQNKFQRHQNFMPLITEEIPSDKGRPELLARNLTLKFMVHQSVI